MELTIYLQIGIVFFLYKSRKIKKIRTKFKIPGKSQLENKHIALPENRKIGRLFCFGLHNRITN